MKVELLDNTKKKKLINYLNDSYGIEELPHLIIKSGNDKYRIYSGNLSKEELNELAKNIHVELIGNRIANIDKGDTRISFDAINIPLIKEQIDENILEINDEQTIEWMKGNDLQIKIETKSRFVVIKNNNDFLGVGRVQRDFIKNYVPKERRIR